MKDEKSQQICDSSFLFCEKCGNFTSLTSIYFTCALCAGTTGWVRTFFNSEKTNIRLFRQSVFEISGEQPAYDIWTKPKLWMTEFEHVTESYVRIRCT